MTPERKAHLRYEAEDSEALGHYANNGEQLNEALDALDAAEAIAADREKQIAGLRILLCDQHAVIEAAEERIAQLELAVELSRGLNTATVQARDELLDAAEARIAQAITTARAEGRAAGIREAACISPCYWDLELSLRRRLEADILALLDAPQGDDQ